MKYYIPHSADRGFSLIEVLVTLLIVSVGLMGIARLLTRAHISEMESYQRVQAVILLGDIVERIKVNSEVASCFAITTDTTTTGSPFIGAAGDGHLGEATCTASVTTYNTQAIDTIDALDDLLAGAAEVKDGQLAGAMIGARGCVSYDLDTELTDSLGATISGTGEFTVTIAWQGLVDTAVASSNCANGLYGDEKRRRAVSTTLRLAKLD